MPPSRRPFRRPPILEGNILRPINNARNNAAGIIEDEGDIELNDREAMIVYASEHVDQTPKPSNNNLPEAPPAPILPPATQQSMPSTSTQQTANRSSLFESIKSGKTLKKGKTKIVENVFAGKIVDKEDINR